MKFKIPVTYTMTAEYEVEAESLEEAIKLVDSGDPPYDFVPKGQYMDDSIIVDRDFAREINDNNN